MKNRIVNHCVLIIFLCTFFSFHGSSQPSWTVSTNAAPDSSGSLMLLMSDGSVLCKTIRGRGDRIGNGWNKLTPDASGSYVNGTWSRICPMKDSRQYFSSQTLRNGKIYVAGGEYGTGGYAAEVFDPVTNSWTQLNSPVSYYGDANSAILDDGKILQSSLQTFNKVFVYNPSSNTFTSGPNSTGGHNESSWLKLPDNSIMFVDIGSQNSERYIPSTNQWIGDATVTTNLYDPWGFETGPGFLLPDGRLFCLGSPGSSAFYTPSGNTAAGTWSTGPTVPGNNGLPDAPGAMMADGKIVFAAGPKPVSTSSVFMLPTYFYEYDYLSNSYTQLNAPGGGNSYADTAFNFCMLDLPDGSVMLSKWGLKNYYFRGLSGAPLAAGKPTVSTVSQAGCGNSFTVTGLLFNGICEGASYGDDWQMNTNWPIVRLQAGSNVYYARTYNWNHTAVRSGSLPDTTQFSLPPAIPPGTYSLSVIANGNASLPVTFTFAPFPVLTSSLALPDICTGTSFSYNAMSNSSLTNVLWTRPAVPGISNPPILTPQSSDPNEVLQNPGNISRTAVYLYTLGLGPCTASYAVNVVVNPATVSVSGNLVVCEGSPALLNGSGALSYTWSTGTTGNAISLSPLITTGYTLSATNDEGCTAATPFTITVRPLPTMSVTPNSTICAGDTKVLYVLGNGINFSWNQTGETADSLSVKPQANTVYTVNSYSQFNCKRTMTLSVAVDPCTSLSADEMPDLMIYPIPAHDELLLKLQAGSSNEYLVKIYDARGKLVFDELVYLHPTENPTGISIANAEKGLYLLNVRCGERNYLQKFVKD
jgi:hypothetical protein